MTAQVSFFKLPLELLEMIFQHLRQSPHSLSSLALTCRQFHAVTTPALYSSICLRNTLSSEQLARTLQQNFSLSSLVLELQVHFHNTQMDPTYESLLDAICEMHNLERLSVRSIPLQDIFESTNHRLLTMLGTNKNNVEIESPTQYAGQRLRSLYLGAAFTDRDEDKWVLGCNEIVFYMEQLEKLHIQGADIESLHPKHFAASLPSKKTELKELALLNCELSPDTLGRILAFPESFTHFTMKGTCLDVSGDFISCGHSNLNGVSLYKFVGLLTMGRERKKNHDLFNLSEAGDLYPAKQRKSSNKDRLSLETNGGIYEMTRQRHQWDDRHCLRKFIERIEQSSSAGVEYLDFGL